MSGRAGILAAIRTATAARGTPVRPAPAEASPPADPAAQFLRLAAQASATVCIAGSLADVPQAVAEFLQRESLPRRVRVGPALQAAPWGSLEDVELQSGPPAADGETVVTACFCGIAEFGAVALVSGPGHPVESVFLARNHVVILFRSRLVDRLEDLWRLLRQEFPAGLPRTVNVILGPSRTADLGVPSRLGAHGPQRVHVILLEHE